MQITLAFTVLHALWILSLTGCEAYRYRRNAGCPENQSEKWSYGGSNGPSNWGKKYPECNGQKQSPINIETQAVVNDESLGPLQLSNYDKPLTSGKMLNNGHTAEIEPEDDTKRTITINNVVYTLIQCHFHWGDNANSGSEHKINGVQYAMEMHCVHKSDNGNLAAIALLFEEQSENNDAMNPIVDCLPGVEYKDSETELSSPFSFSNIQTTKQHDYYRYQGSLTTPECHEIVTWTILKTPAPIGTQQMNAFRKLKTVVAGSSNSANCQLVNNFRPVQPLNGREVYSFSS